MQAEAIDLEISSDRARLDVALIHSFLSTASYWAQGRTLEDVERSIAHSLCFGVYCQESQVAFGRVVTDYTVFAYLMDVFVLPDWRGRGVGERLVAAMVGDARLRELPVMLLRTKDAQGFYERFGFVPPARPEELMARYRPL